MPIKNRIAALAAPLLLLILAVVPAAAQSDPQSSPTAQAESPQPAAVQPVSPPATPQSPAPNFATAISGERRFEVGVQFSTLMRGTGSYLDDGSSVGGGGRLTFNLIKYLDLEGEFNYFPSNGFANARKIQAQFGAKTGVRFNKFGVFGKLRPGFVNIDYDRYVYLAYRSSRTTFSMDLGGVVEFYPSKRMIVRFDIGDTILAQGDDFAYIYSNTGIISYLAVPGRASHNLQISAGVGFRF